METAGNTFRSEIFLRSVPKGHTKGLDKAVPPAETVRRVKEKFQEIQLQLIHDILRIDSGRLGIPVYVCRAGKDCNIPTPKTMGKGPTPEQSEASALMELVERFSHVNFPRAGGYRRSAFSDMNGAVLPAENFIRLPVQKGVPGKEEMEVFSALPFSWVPAYSLTHGRDFMIPYEWFADIQGTNGLSAGNTLEETVLQGLCEVVERHVSARINTLRRPVPTIDLDTVQDPVADELLEKFFGRGIELLCMDFSMDTGIPTIGGIAFDPSTFPNSEVVFCAGTATHPEKALIRVLTEIQQMAVDDFRQDYYAGGILPKFSHWRESYYLFDKREPVPIQSLPDVSSKDMLEEIKNCTKALNRIGFEPLVIDITHPLLEIPAVFVVIPGTEQYENTTSGLDTLYYLGRRLKFLGDRKGAMEKFQSSMNRNPAARRHCCMEIADCLMSMKRWAEAMELYKEVLGRRPDREMQYRVFRALTVCVDKIKESGKSPEPPVPGSR